MNAAIALPHAASELTKALALALKYEAWPGEREARSAATAFATAGMVTGLYHRCGFGVSVGKPSTMPAVANAIAADLEAIQPAHASYFKANAAAFTASLTAWNNAIAAFKAKYPDTPVATTEPVADYMLQAAGADNLTPFAFQADIMNGTDPSAQDVAVERSLFTQHKVKVFVYNQQVTDSLTESFISLAQANGIPVVGVYETMPVPGYDYQTWMLAEVQDLQKAVVSKASTEHL